jgi:hypothetical protein
MRSSTHLRGPLVGALLLTLAAVGCEQDGPSAPKKSAQPAAKGPEAKRVAMGKNVFLEIQGGKRRVVVLANVCLRTGQLEQLLCRKRTKEHEAILAADVDARDIHKALLLAGAESGHPVKFVPPDKRIPPKGTKIKVLLEYPSKGKTVTIPARQWVRNLKTQKELDVDWVFAGSIFTPDPFDPKAPPFYAANDGDVICLANFETAMLDLPILSSQDAADLAFEAWTARIPPVDTAVTVILEPVLPTKKK